MIKFSSKLGYSCRSILNRLQPGQGMFRKSMQQRIVIVQCELNNQGVFNNFCAFLRDIFSNFGKIPNLIMQRLADDPYMFFKVKVLIKNYIKVTS